MNKKILAEMDFSSLIAEANAQTQTGAELINKYKSFLMANESTCALVNNFVREASILRYDNGVNNVLETVADYINSNKTAWALTSACESIQNSTKSYNYLQRNAAKQVEKLLEMQEEDIVKYIKAGALKNVMYCESFRNIAKQVFKDSPLVEATAEYTKVTPVSIIENMGDGLCFQVAGALYKINEDKEIETVNWNEVSNTFKTVSQLLESNITSIDQHTITVSAGNATYEICEADKVTRIGKEGTKTMSVEEMRDNNRMVLMATNPRYRNQMAGVLEAIALTCENYNSIVTMDNVAIYSTKKDKFVVIESGNNLYAKLLASNHSQAWTINENAVDALSFIKSKTNTSLSENYTELVEASIASVSEAQQEEMKAELKNQTNQSYKERIESLTEKFKNDPIKLAVLSKLAQELADVE